MSTFTIFLALIVIVAFLLVVVIMVQNPKGGGLSSSFGGSGQQVGGVKKTGDFLDKSTWTLATLLLVLILLSNVTIMDDAGYGESKVFDEASMPQDTTTPPSQMPGQSTESDSAQ